MHLSLELHSQDDATDHAAIIKELAGYIRLAQGVPVGVGSGKKSLHYKMHGLIHANKLISLSWKSNAAILNGTVTVVGDLGESTVQNYHGDTRRVFGNWIEPLAEPVQSEDDFDFDAPLHPVEHGEPVQSEDGFDFDAPLQAIEHGHPAQADDDHDLDDPDYPLLDDLWVDFTRTFKLRIINCNE